MKILVMIVLFGAYWGCGLYGEGSTPRPGPRAGAGANQLEADNAVRKQLHDAEERKLQAAADARRHEAAAARLLDDVGAVLQEPALDMFRMHSQSSSNSPTMYRCGISVEQIAQSKTAGGGGLLATRKELCVPVREGVDGITNPQQKKQIEQYGYIYIANKWLMFAEEGGHTDPYICTSAITSRPSVDGPTRVRCAHAIRDYVDNLRKAQRADEDAGRAETEIRELQKASAMP